MFFSHPENFYKYPGRLTWLCAEALGKLVSSVLMRIVIQKQNHLVKEVCEHLQQMLHFSLPETVADEMKIRILLEYEKIYLKLSEISDLEVDYQDIATEIFIAILHPSVTKIECIENTCHPKYLDGFKMKFSDLIYNAIVKLNNIRVLRIGNASSIDTEDLGSKFNDRISKNIEEFGNAFSTGLEIITLSDHCKKLKILDVGVSELVYDDSIDDILKMECLEDLDIHYASISTDGLQDLLDGLVNTKQSNGKFASERLKRFVCDGLLEEQVSLLGDKFPNLTNLGLMSTECDLGPLKTLKQLKSLHYDESYRYLKELLSCIGRQLVCLNLCNIRDTDLEHVASTCPNLSCLHLANSFSVENNSNISDCHKVLSVPEFPQVSSLELYIDCESGIITQYMISRFKNVRRLFLSNCNNDNVFSFVLEREYTKHLEVVFFKKFNDIFVVLQFREKYALITNFPVYCRDLEITVYSCTI